ncbi:MAG TPA: hypothetical protein VHB70_19010, partial [Parafilimonas sp.]|nr:hypothetical protein [Parafilimonas sp.]
MSATQQQKNQHLLWRAGFGINTETIKNIDVPDHKVLYTALENASLPQPNYIDVADDTIKGLVMGFQQV